MSADDFLKFMNTARNLYGDKFPKLSKEVLNVWYECLSDLDINALNAALINHVKTCEFPPTVAALRRECNEIRDKNAKNVAELKRLYRMTIAFYPNAVDSNNLFEIWVALHEGKPMNEKLDIARRILNHVCTFVRRCEESGVDDIPTLEEFLKGVNPDELFS